MHDTTTEMDKVFCGYWHGGPAGHYWIGSLSPQFEAIMDPLRLFLPQTAEHDADVLMIAQALQRLLDPVADFPCPTQPYTMLQDAQTLRARSRQGIVWAYAWEVYRVYPWGSLQIPGFILTLPRTRDYDAVLQTVVDALRRMTARQQEGRMP